MVASQAAGGDSTKADSATSPADFADHTGHDPDGSGDEMASPERELPASGEHMLARKRKTPSHETESDTSRETSPRDTNKKAKVDNKNVEMDSAAESLPADRSALPPEIWHRIFTFCPPKSLGGLLAVNKLFNLYLDPQSTVHRGIPSSPTRGALEPMKPNTIWQASRRLFWPNMPSPLRTKTELDMWRLACSYRCYSCGKLDPRKQSAVPDSNLRGPGEHGVAAIWAFGSCMCAACLLKHTIKQLDLELSPTIPSSVIPALPFVLLTNDLQVLPPVTSEQGQPPADLQVTKRFLSSEVEELEREFLEVKDMGPGTVTEWLKGLPGRGSELRHDASKWEKWEGLGGPAKMCSLLYPGYVKEVMITMPAPTTPSTDLSSSMLLSHPLPTAIRQQLPHARHERTAAEVAELKAQRRAEIERRALLLDPPLGPNVLRHIPSFQAAMQIVHPPFDEKAWEILKPRLLAQRADAEQREGEIAAANQAKQESHLETTLASTKEARDLIDKAWEDQQGPLRERISGYADEIIRDGWGNGKKVTKETCGRFAIEALGYVRKRFYAEIAKDIEAARSAGQTPPVDPPEGPFTQKLTLENMKWIFDTKIKTITERYRRELFYCNGCEGNSKTFGFEGVIQHYAAKHTSALSSGSIVVHWRAEWPEHPPFAAEIRPVRHQPFFAPGQPAFPVTGPPALPISHSYPSAPLAPNHLSTYPPTPYGYGNPPYNDPYQPPPPAYPLQPTHPAPPFPPHPGYEHHQPYPPPSDPYLAYQPPGGQYHPGPAPVVDPAHGYPPQPPQGGHYDHSYPPYPPNPVGHPYIPPPPAYHDIHKAKIEDVARNSREVWQTLGNIRGLPGSVRVFVTIHHLVKRFHARFYETPPLAIFIEGLSNNKDMRPVRNVNDLVCKACHLGLGNAATVEQDRKSFSLPQLTNHFQSRHVAPLQSAHAPPMDWTLDMVLLPELAALSDLRSAMSEAQKGLLVEALPGIFQQPAPALVPAGSYYSQPAANQYEQLSPAGYPTAQGAPQASSAAGYGNAASLHGHSRPDAGNVANDTPTSATPTAVSDNALGNCSEGGGHSSQGSRPPNRRQNGFQNSKKAFGKNKRKRNHDGDDSGDRRVGRDFRRDEANSRRGNTGDDRGPSSSIRTERAPVPGSSVVGLPAQDHQTADSHANDILAALESQLNQPPSPRSHQHQSQPTSVYQEKRTTLVPVDPPRYDARPHARQHDHEDRHRYLEPQTRERTSVDRRLEQQSSYHPRPEAEHLDYRYPTTPGEVTGARHAAPDERYYSRHERHAAFLPGEPERAAGLRVVREDSDYPRYRDEFRRPMARDEELIEVVEVFDGERSYIIRRPARREPETRYMYEERAVPHREPVDRYAEGGEYESGYASVARSAGSIQEMDAARRYSMAPETRRRPNEGGASNDYVEEYDPRFPAA
ncbi:hypothetical protein QBC40DRAFT_100639 [Triangularia verruculosa]|uniref:DUF7892 domain-containing protein n=1 Tax=Triangularia verruculosa TaxID=2587418 RepID=A0AAN6XCE6_9PEZI|nr:hypothetical protein QBC40DRAFT_100639 [Triangularia verruculosa]